MDAHPGHEHQPGGHGDHGSVGLTTMAASATLHCLTGCAIGEITGLLIGTGAQLGTAWTVALSVALAFFFGYLLSTLPVLRAGIALGSALRVVLAADTVSIATMEVVDNAVMAALPGAMEAGLVNVVFWVGMAVSLVAAFVAAYPVNRLLLARGRGHALTHAHHADAQPPAGVRRLIPTIPTGALVAALVAFLLGGLVVSLADELSGGGPAPEPAHSAPAS